MLSKVAEHISPYFEPKKTNKTRCSLQFISVSGTKLLYKCFDFFTPKKVNTV